MAIFKPRRVCYSFSTVHVFDDMRQILRRFSGLLTLTFLWLLSGPVTAGQSPYLEHHADDLVNWLPWQTDTLARAESESKLILVSSGYLACRYCYIMKNESFENEEIASFINKNFIPVLIDRELDPELDSQLLKFMEIMELPQGWPLQVILTPKRHPLIGALYQPPEDFLALLTLVQGRWMDNPQQLASTAERANNSILSDLSVPAFAITERLRQQFITALRQQTLLAYDGSYGGFGNGPKYPMAPQLHALLAMNAIRPDPEITDLLRQTLDAMANSALFDPVQGGFFRYSTTPNWQIPHFEKMLDTNAQLASLYLDASLQFNNPFYLEIARQTLDLLIEQFQLANGGYASSLSAVDAGGKDGGAYLWQESEIRSVLSDVDWRELRTEWQNITSLEEDAWLPVLADLRRLPLPSEEQNAWMAKFAKLKQYRGPITVTRDEKMVTSGQGLVLKALSRFAVLAGEPLYEQTAKRLYSAITDELWQDQLLKRSNLGGAGSLADYAYLAEGLLSYAQLTGDQTALTWAKELIADAWQRFYLEGVWRQSEQLDRLLPYTVYPATLSDTQLPSPSAVLIKASLALGDQLEEATRAQALLAKSSADANMAESPFFHATQIISLMENHDSTQSN